MFCKYCGAQIADGSKFCASCGGALEEKTAPAAEPVYAAPSKPLSKKQYFSKVAPMGQRIKRLIAFVVGLLCILSVYLATNKTVNGSLFELPIFSVLVEEDVSDMQAELDEALAIIREEDDMDELALFLEDMLETDVTLSELRGAADEVMDLCSPLSLSSLVELGEMFGAENSEVVEIMSIVVKAIWATAIGLMVLTAFGVLFRRTGLMIFCMIPGVAFIAITGGATYALMAAVAYVFSAILFSSLNRDYKAYKAACKRGR